MKGSEDNFKYSEYVRAHKGVICERSFKKVGRSFQRALRMTSEGLWMAFWRALRADSMTSTRSSRRLFRRPQTRELHEGDYCVSGRQTGGSVWAFCVRM